MAQGSYADVLERLYALGPGRMRRGREPLRRVLKLAGNPHLAVPSILVGGTNGKGQLVAALSAVLGLRLSTGAFLKPHLKTIRERWRVHDEPVAEEEFTAAASRALELIASSGEELSFFEANVLTGALIFEQAGCDIAVWEVGLGGREDACNLVEPLISVLTNVGYDHQQVLGDTLAEIARDKAYIARENQPLVLGPPRPGWDSAYAEYEPVVRAVAAELGADYTPLIAPTAAEWEQYFSVGARSLPPDTAVLLEHVLVELGQFLPVIGRISTAELQFALSRRRYRARMERTRLRGRSVLLDAAHNVDSLRWLAHALGRLHPGRRLPVIFGCQSTRDPLELLRELQPVISTLTPVEIPVMHPCPVSEVIAAALELDIPLLLPSQAMPGALAAEYPLGANSELAPPDNSTRWQESVEHALDRAAGAPLVVCGSIYYLGEILRSFGA